MATAATVKNVLKHLQCPICLDVFDNPKQLACHHIFCKSCLDEVVQFNRDGEGTMNCSHKCAEDTTIPTTHTTNDLDASYLKNIFDEFTSNSERLDVSENQCGITKCQNIVCTFCLVCKTFMCKACKKEHDGDQSNHASVQIAVSKDNSLKVLCEKHNTQCEYMCCSNEVVCVYCVNRRHLHHPYELSENHAKIIKEKLVMQICNIKEQSSTQPCAVSKQNICERKEHFEQAIKFRKIKCLYKYISLLRSEEQVMREQFDILCVEHQKEFDISQSANPLEDMLKWTGLELCILVDNVVDSVYQLSNTLSHHTTSLSESDILSEHPLGELVIAVGEVLDNELDDTSSFTFNATDVLYLEDDVCTELLQELKDLLQEPELFTNWAGVGDISAPPPDFVDVTALSVKGKLRKEVITMLKSECGQELENRGFDYIQMLIENDDEDKLKLLISERPGILTMRGGDWSGTPSIVAAQFNKLEMLKFLLNIVNVDDTDRDGDTVLHHASYYGSPDCLTWLCEGKCSHLLNAKNKDGRTALHWAVYEGHVDNVEILCKHNVDIDIKDNYGYTALDVARLNNRHQCAQALLNAIQERDEKALKETLV